MKIAYVHKKFSASTMELIDHAISICEEYEEAGYSLTLRQLYYQFVSRDLLANTVANYSRLGDIVSDARLAGLMDWDWLEDRTRNLKQLPSWSSPSDILHACAQQFRMPAWEDQDYRVEIWVEKEALSDVVSRAADPLRVPYFACKGYVSQSEMHAAALRFRQHNADGHKVVVIHVGDHDPSGIDMTRDIHDRLKMFQVEDIEVQRVALTFAQVEEYQPPPNPAKTTDARFRSYAAKFGDESWELDALSPSQLRQILEDEVSRYLDRTAFDAVIRRENVEKRTIAKVANNWSAVKAYLINSEL